MIENTAADTAADLLLTPNPRRFVLFPIQDQEVWDAARLMQASAWTTAEVTLDDDVRQWRDRLTDDERRFVSRVLAFFAAADGIVNENLAVRFMGDVQLAEARAFYAHQIANEQVHAEMYSLLIATLIEDARERDALFDAAQSVPSIAAKARWAMRWLDDRNATFGERLAAFACVEGIFFSSSFCAIFWLKKRNLMPGLTASNEWISKDEATHQRFACLLLRKLSPRNRPSSARVVEIVRDAVDVELQFVRDALSTPLIGINADMMCQYVECVADHLLSDMNAPPAYHTKNPFDWMVLMSVERKTNFFERRVTDYGKWQTATGTAAPARLSTDGEF